MKAPAPAQTPQRREHQLQQHNTSYATCTSTESLQFPLHGSMRSFPPRLPGLEPRAMMGPRVPIDLAKRKHSHVLSPSASILAERCVWLDQTCARIFFPSSMSAATLSSVKDKGRADRSSTCHLVDLKRAPSGCGMTTWQLPITSGRRPRRDSPGDGVRFREVAYSTCFTGAPVAVVAILSVAIACTARLWREIMARRAGDGTVWLD